MNASDVAVTEDEVPVHLRRLTTPTFNQTFIRLVAPGEVNPTDIESFSIDQDRCDVLVDTVAGEVIGVTITLWHREEDADDAR